MGHKSGRALSTTASFCSSFVIISCQAARIGYLADPAASIRHRDPCCTMRSARRAWLRTHEQQQSFQNNTSSLHYFISVTDLLALFSKSCFHSLRNTKFWQLEVETIICHVMSWEPTAQSREHARLLVTWRVSFPQNTSLIKWPIKLAQAVMLLSPVFWECSFQISDLTPIIASFPWFYTIPTGNCWKSASN